jgi:putative endonuclease
VYFVYILLCSDKTLYTGIAKDPQKRFLEHQLGRGGAYTRSHPPIKIIYTESCPDKSSALKREAQIKKWSHNKKLEFANLNSSPPLN